MVANGRSARRWGAYAALGIAVTLCGVSSLAATRADGQEPHSESGAQQANAEQRGTQAVPFVVRQVESQESEQRAADVAKAAESEAQDSRNLLHATYALALAAFLQWVILVVQTRHIGRSARVAERALTELERPYVFVKFGRPGLVVRQISRNTDDGGIETKPHSLYSGEIEIHFSNYGRSPAILTELLDVYDPTSGKTAMPYALSPETQRGRPLPGGTAIAPGKKYTLRKNPSEAFKQELGGASLVDNRFFCLGILRYQDIFGSEYALGYCGYFDWERAAFVLEGDSAYNFTKTIKPPKSGGFGWRGLKRD